MSDEKKENPREGEDTQKPAWSHDSELSFKNVRDQLELAKDGVQDAIDAYKKRIQGLMSIRDSYGKK